MLCTLHDAVSAGDLSDAKHLVVLRTHISLRKRSQDVRKLSSQALPQRAALQALSQMSLQMWGDGRVCQLWLGSAMLHE